MKIIPFFVLDPALLGFGVKILLREGAKIFIGLGLLPSPASPPLGRRTRPLAGGPIKIFAPSLNRIFFEAFGLLLFNFFGAGGLARLPVFFNYLASKSIALPLCSLIN